MNKGYNVINNKIAEIAISHLENNSFYIDQKIKSFDINVAKKIINHNYIPFYKKSINNSILGNFNNEACLIKFNEEKNDYVVNRYEVDTEYFEEKSNKFDLSQKTIKGFQCANNFLRKNKCVYETCPYLIALYALDVAVDMIKSDSSYINEEKERLEKQNSNTNFKSSKKYNLEYKVNINKDKDKEINDEILSINNLKIQDELLKIKTRINLVENDSKNEFIPEVYLVTGDNKILKKKIINVLSNIILSSNNTLKNNTANVLIQDKFNFNDSLTVVKNLEKLSQEGYAYKKEIFLNTVYSLEENIGYVILDTDNSIGIDLDTCLSKNLKTIRFEVNDYNEEELIDLFYETAKTLNLKFDRSVSELFKNGYMKTYMKINNNLKNKSLIDKLVSNVLDNISKNNYKKDFINSSLFPDILDKSKERKSVEDKLNDLIGLDNVKKQIKDLIHYLTFLKKVDNKINMPILNLHSVFTGSPGTGKTTVARIYANLLYELGYIKENKLIEVAREDLIAEYVGQTSIKTKKVFEKAMGGVLFIDEAYALTPTGGNGFESECISTIIKIMEDRRDDIVVIFAGYEKDMQKFLDANEGLRSRVTNNIFFNDYSSEELYQIFEKAILDMNLKLDSSIKPKVIEIINEAKKDKKFGNGRYIMNLRQKVLMKHAINTAMANSEEELLTIVENDLL